MKQRRRLRGNIAATAMYEQTMKHFPIRLGSSLPAAVWRGGRAKRPAPEAEVVGEEDMVGEKRETREDRDKLVQSTVPE